MMTTAEGTSTLTGRRTHTVLDTPIGQLTLVGTDGVVAGLYFPQHRHAPDPSTFGQADADGFVEVARQLAEYFAGDRQEFTVPLAPAGTPFQQAVWAALRQVGYGEQRSYTELARSVPEVISPEAAGSEPVGPEADRRRLARLRAVAAANGRNPISILIPCHRIVGADGSLTGYAGGLDRKRYLLELESDRAGRGQESGRLF